jgi:hypothetical protein
LVQTRETASQLDTELTSNVRAWASQFASENCDMVSAVGYYVPPRAFGEMQRQLGSMSGGIIGLVGLQGVGKSTALRVLQIFDMIKQDDSHKKQHKESFPSHLLDTVLFKWRRQPQLLKSLLNGTRELSGDFSRVYKSKLVEQAPHQTGAQSICDPNPRSNRQDCLTEEASVRVRSSNWATFFLGGGGGGSCSHRPL